MDYLTIILTAVPAALAIAALVLAIINSVKLRNLRENLEVMDNHLYAHCNDICDLMEEVDNIDTYLENLEECLNHNVDMTNITLRNFKVAVEKDRRELREIQKVAELHQDALELMKQDLELCNETTNDTLDLIEDILIADSLVEDETTEWCCCKTWEDDDFEYFETKETKKTKRPKTKK